MGLFEVIIALIIISLIYKFITKGMDNRDSKYPTEDAELMQQLNRTVSRMEQRIEALETILMDRVDRPENTHHEHQSAPQERTTE